MSTEITVKEAEVVGASNNAENENQLATAPAQAKMGGNEVKFEAWKDPVKKYVKFYDEVGGPRLSKLDSFLCFNPCGGFRCACNKAHVGPILANYPGTIHLDKNCFIIEGCNSIDGWACCSGDHNFCLNVYQVKPSDPDLKDVFDANGKRKPEWGNLDAWQIEGNPPCLCMRGCITSATLFGDYGCGFKKATTRYN